MQLRVFAPLANRSTYRRWAGLILGGALLMPYMMVADLALSGVRDTDPAVGAASLADPVTFLAVLPVVAVTGLVLPIRAMSISAARLLFGVRLEAHEAEAQTWPQRWRTATWFTVLAGLGGVVSGLTLAMVPFAIWLCVVPFTGDVLVDGPLAAQTGWAAAWMLPVGLAIVPALIYVVAGAGAVLARLAPVVLGPTPEDRLAAAERRSSRLAERNRLARELHDSVGHALSVVTVQAAAAGRVLSADPEFAHRALGAIEDSARGALEDLDYVLGLLREEDAPDALEPTLAALDDLVRSTGLSVRYDVVGPVDQVPRTVSREAYRVVQEGLTNALRHGDSSAGAGLRVAVVDEHLEVEMTNTVTGRPIRVRLGGGRGLRGMRERVELLRGDFDAGEVDGQWRLRARFPLRASGVRP